jgi:amidophosphoribosyltransferase
MIVINKDGIKSYQLAKPNLKLDIFEFVYFARPDSTILGRSVYEVRKAGGMKLAEEFPVDADMIVAVPDTATAAAVGYSQVSGIPVEWALVKNRYIHRTFIQPDQHTRDLGVKLKLNPLTAVIKGKRIILIDDSIVRGTTSRQIIKALFESGATEVHFLVSSPPVKFPDFYGIDTPKQEKLIAAQMDNNGIKEYLGATSLYYLSLEGLLASTGLPPENFSTSCFTGEYPIDLLHRRKEVNYAV